MDYAHHSQPPGTHSTIRGMTHLKFTSLIYFQEDCHDPGALLYDHVPVLGSVTAYLRKRMAERQ